jgi:hypothetical protein
MDCYTTFWLRDGIAFDDCLRLFARLGEVEAGNATWARFRWSPVAGSIPDTFREVDGGHGTFGEQTSMLGFRERADLGPVLSWTTSEAGLYEGPSFVAGAANVLRQAAMARLFVEANLALCVAAGGTGFEIDAPQPTARTLARTAFFAPAALAPELAGFVRLGDIMIALDAIGTMSRAGALAAAGSPARFSALQLELGHLIETIANERTPAPAHANGASPNGAHSNGANGATRGRPVVSALEALERALEELREALRR